MNKDIGKHSNFKVELHVHVYVIFLYQKIFYRQTIHFEKFKVDLMVGLLTIQPPA